MCLGIPGRIIERWTEPDGAIMARADFAGEERRIRLNYLPDLAVGDFTIVHAGFALTRMGEDEAARTIEMMRSVGLLDSFPAPPSAPSSSAPAAGVVT